jgi:enamine deaminase RidA (YjgF/YER057c/UK114 family)
MDRSLIDLDWSWPRRYNISVGRRVGRDVYLSGLVAFDGDGVLVGEGDVYLQSLQIFRNIDQALASVGGNLSDVVRITTYLTDMTRYVEFARARAEIFPHGSPASTAVATPALVMPQLLVEVEATAILAGGSRELIR